MFIKRSAKQAEITLKPLKVIFDKALADYSTRLQQRTPQASVVEALTCREKTETA